MWLQLVSDWQRTNWEALHVQSLGTETALLLLCGHPTFPLPVALCPRLTSSPPQVSRCFCSSTHVYSCFPAVSTTPNLTLSTWEKNQWSTLQKTDWRPSSRALGQAVFPNSSGLTLHAGSTPKSQMGLCLKNCRDGGVVWFCWIFLSAKEHWKAFPGLAIGPC